MERPIIDIKDVSFTYAATDESEDVTPALSHINLKTNPGEFVGILGPSGAGKSTLAAIMSGAIPHHFKGTLYGSTLIEGKDTCDISLTDISQTVGSVLQDIDTQMVASVVEDEMLFGLENFGVPHNQIEQRITDTLNTVGIADLRDREIATLSGGQKQKVAIAAILAMQPKVLVLDEPTAALDPASSKLVFDTLRDVHEQGVTVIVIEQKVALLSQYCDRIVVIDHGKIFLDGTPKQTFAHAEELRKLGVDSPRVARVSNSLAHDGFIKLGHPCLDVPEATAMVEQLIPHDLLNSDIVEDDDPVYKGSKHVVSPRPHAQDAEPILSIRDVSFQYPGGGGRVDDLNMSVYPGEMVGVIGQNGAGKTTLMKLICGLLKPNRGNVLLAGLNTREVPTSRIAGHCSILFQNPDYQLCKNTVTDEVAFGLELQGVDSTEARRRANKVIERFGLPAEESPFSLSRGQRQVVALASVVVMQPDLVLLDEPTSGLDYRECMTVMDTVSEMANNGCAVVVVCHDMEVVSDFTERVMVMANGKILGRGPTQQMFENADLMHQAYIQAPQIVQLSQELTHTVSPEFSGISQVSGMVGLIEEMVRHG